MRRFDFQYLLACIFLHSNLDTMIVAYTLEYPPPQLALLVAWSPRQGYDIQWHHEKHGERLDTAFKELYRFIGQAFFDLASV